MNETNAGITIHITRWIIDIITAVAIAIFLVWSLGTRVIAEGHSMETVLEDGDVLLLNKLSYNFTDVHRFDIVYYVREGDDGTVSSLKRVVGLPGETICINDGKILIDQAVIELPEDMRKYTVPGIAGEPLYLQEDEYFLLGDNGDSSEDSRFSGVGIIKESEIEGKVWFRLKPYTKIGPVE